MINYYNIKIIVGDTLFIKHWIIKTSFPILLISFIHSFDVYVAWSLVANHHKRWTHVQVYSSILVFRTFHQDIRRVRIIVHLRLIFTICHLYWRQTTGPNLIFISQYINQARDLFIRLMMVTLFTLMVWVLNIC